MEIIQAPSDRDSKVCGPSKDYDNSMLNTYRECPRRFYHSFVRGISTIFTPDYFTAGRAWQEGLVSYYNNSDLSMDERLTLAREAIYKVYNDSPPVYDPKRTAENLCKLIERYSQTFPSEPWDVKKMEIGFKIPLTPDINICGSIDGYGEWEAVGGAFILENKTTKGYLTQYWLQEYDLDNQITTYYWAGTKLISNMKGILMNKCSLDIPARPTTQRTLFVRGLQHRSEEQLDRFEDEIILLVADIYRDYDRWQWPMRGRFCSGGYGLRACEYKDLCVNQPSKPLDEIHYDVQSFAYREWKPWERDGENE